MAVPVLKGPFTVDTYQRLGELGILGPHDRVELIAGQVVEMSPIGDRHAACVRRLNRLLSEALRDAAIIDVQNPVVLDDRDAPQPDVTVLRPRRDAYPKHPRAADVLLVIEVSDTTLAYDRDVKVPLYGRAGIPETWLVDLTTDRIHVYRERVAGEYANVRAVSGTDTVTPLHVPEVIVAASEILG